MKAASLLPRAACALFLATLPGCHAGPERIAAQPASRRAPEPLATPLRVHFTDATAGSGIRFRHNSGASGLKLMPESLGSGVAFIDFDGDGFQDIFLVNGRDWTDGEINAYRQGKLSERERQVFEKKHGRFPTSAAEARPLIPHRARCRSTGALYRNNGNGTFSDATRGSGLDIEMQGMGAAVGDYDGDGKSDLYVTAVGRNYLFRNRSQNRSQSSKSKRARFDEVARAAQVLDGGWSSGAAWLDFDRDGKLDLLVTHYVRWTPANDVFQSLDGRHKTYSGPPTYEPQASRLYRNVGARFQDVSAQTGISQRRDARTGQGKPKALLGKGLGVAVCDLNSDGWPDVIVTNDTTPNFLFENRGGRFEEIGLRSGIAYSDAGVARAGMGVDVADIDHSGRDSIVIGNFSTEMLGLYYNKGGGALIDLAPHNEVGKASQKFLTFGCAFVDVDNDGYPDILTANGHVMPDLHTVRRDVTYAQRPLLFHNVRRGLFKEIGLSSGQVLARPLVARGLACADIDLDGDVDAILTTSGGAPVLMRNDGGSSNRSIRLVLRGARGNRDAIGALVKVKLGASDGLRRWVRSGSSYLSQSELPLTLGLGQVQRAQVITIRWPSGARTQLRDVEAGQILTVQEGRGVVRRQPFTRR